MFIAVSLPIIKYQNTKVLLMYIQILIRSLAALVSLHSVCRHCVVVVIIFRAGDIVSVVCFIYERVASHLCDTLTYPAILSNLIATFCLHRNA